MDYAPLESLTIKDAGADFNGDALRQLCKPCVYVFLKDDLVLYVGRSRRGLRRIFDMAHKAARIALEECTSFRIFPCVDNESSQKLEDVLISRLRPNMNKAGRKKHAAKLLGTVNLCVKL